jgi:predicted metal-dependent hydrolase
MTKVCDTVILKLPDESSVPVNIRSSARARRILLHVGVYDGKVEIVLPPGASRYEGLGFARTQTGWIVGQLGKIGGGVPFDDGSRFPLLGEKITIRRNDNRSAIPILIERELLVGGRDDTLSDRVKRWIRARALDEIQPRAHFMGSEIGRYPARITMRDTRSRWGSCSRAGNLNFSWRLVMAPEYVLNYVIAHEVAHLRELNHSDRFWAVVNSIYDDVPRARSWLRKNGAVLHRYGRETA